MAINTGGYSKREPPRTRGGGEGQLHVPRKKCPAWGGGGGGGGDNISQRGTFIPRHQCPGGHFLQGDSHASDPGKLNRSKQLDQAKFLSSQKELVSYQPSIIPLDPKSRNDRNVFNGFITK